MLLDPHTAWIGTVVCLTILIIFSAVAVYISVAHKSTSKLTKTLIGFLGAPRTNETLRGAYAFYGAALGSWVLYAPAEFCVGAEGKGVVGAVAYAMGVAVPLVVVGVAGPRLMGLTKRLSGFGNADHSSESEYSDGSDRSSNSDAHDAPPSITSFVLCRFGFAPTIFVAIITLLNLSMALIAELAAIAALAHDLLGIHQAVPPVVIVVLATIYTSVGGLPVSLITALWQSIASLILAGISIIFLATSLKSLPPLPPQLAPSVNALTAFPSLIIPMTTATFFSDVMWQRVWASTSSSSLLASSIIAAVLSGLVTFLFAFGGILAIWSNRASASDYPSLAFFYAFKASDSEYIPFIPAISLLLIASILNLAAVDSIITAITSTIISTGSLVFPNTTITTVTARIVVIVSSIPIIFIAMQRISIISIFLFSNIISSCAFVPFFMGLLPMFDNLVNGINTIVSSITALVVMSLWAWYDTGSLYDGIMSYFFSTYDYRVFVITIVSSGIAAVVFGVIEKALKYMTGSFQMQKNDTSDLIMSESMITTENRSIMLISSKDKTSSF